MDRILRRAELHRAPVRGPTYHFNRGLGLIPGIDHILGSAEVSFDEAFRLRDRYDGRYPSDHYPVHAQVHLLRADR